MIPKIIHYCWLSGDSFPADIQRCIDTWHERLPDYELWLWDTKRFDINSTLWTQQAFENKKYAFAADYIRLYALYNYGGIYLDADVLVYRNFDDLLHLPYFVGCDQIGAFEAAVIGAEKGCGWIGDVLEHYVNRPFIKSDGEMDMLALPSVFLNELVVRKYTFRKERRVPSAYSPLARMSVFDGSFFNSRNSVEVHRTKNSYCAHNYAGSWLMPHRGKLTLKQMLPKWLLRILLDVSHATWTRNKFRHIQIPFT